ncbi:vitelline membrane protein Vm32E-like [Haematobia irritans]|uniref:vitelline membrane protein Vm32E-like n=1 Tax=Haematobia irritans TaxID=7368 RepID=UPI003F5010E3
MKAVGVLILAIAALFTIVAANGYGAGSAPVSIPAPPCPKNYMFSCQPNLAPAPCSQPAAYASAGSYSENYPVIVNPPFPAPQGAGAGYQQFNNGPNYPNFYIQGGPSN